MDGEGGDLGYRWSQQERGEGHKRQEAGCIESEGQGGADSDTNRGRRGGETHKGKTKAQDELTLKRLERLQAKTNP